MENKRNILLISNYVFHYREKVYNYFCEEFKKDNYSFSVLSDQFQDVEYDLKFEKIETGLSFANCRREINRKKPVTVILFLHLKDLCMIPVIWYCKMKKIPVIYWNHGINIETPDAKVKNFIFHRIHDWCDALITYTPNQRKYFSEKNQKKLFIAYNTLNFFDINKGKYINERAAIKDKFGIKYNKCVLFAARIKPRKRLDILVNIMKRIPEAALLIVGSGITEEMKNDISSFSNIYYLGSRYAEEMNEIFSIADVFCIPRWIGLNMNEALFWNVPICLLKGPHGPEIYYMKDGQTGFAVENEEELEARIRLLLNDDKVHSKIVEGCQKEYEDEVDIGRMYQGFISAVQYCQREVLGPF